MPCRWASNLSLVKFDVVIASISDFHVSLIETEKLLAATVQSELENWRSSGFLGISRHLWIGPANQLAVFVLDVSMNQMSWLSQICHVGKNTKEPCSGIEAPFLLNCVHLDTKVERACTILCISHLQNGIASCRTWNWHRSDILMDSLHALPLHSLLDRDFCLVSLRPTIFDSAYCYVTIPFSAGTSPLLHALWWFLSMTGIGIHRVLTAGACLTFQCSRWLDNSSQRREMLFLQRSAKNAACSTWKHASFLQGFSKCKECIAVLMPWVNGCATAPRSTAVQASLPAWRSYWPLARQDTARWA